MFTYQSQPIHAIVAALTAICVFDKLITIDIGDRMPSRFDYGDLKRKQGSLLVKARFQKQFFRRTDFASFLQEHEPQIAPSYQRLGRIERGLEPMTSLEMYAFLRTLGIEDSNFFDVSAND